MHTYIGSRYVPKFMGNHDNTQIYEALCVVDNGMGTSYISTKPVPAGTPLTDTSYWAVYGASSGAIINLQNQINDMNDGSVSGSLQNQINDNNAKIKAMGDINATDNKAIFIGDSFMVAGVATSIANKFKIAADNAYYYGNTGAGYCHINPLGEPYGAYNFKGCLELALAAVIADGFTGSDINYIFVCGGINDQNESAADFESAVNAFMAYAYANFPNAKVLIGANGPKAALTFNYTHMIDLIYTYANMYGFYALRGIEHTLYNMSNLVDSDNIHPNANGCNVLGYNYKAMYLGNTPNSRSYEYSANGTNCTGTVRVLVDSEKAVITYDLTWVDSTGASTGITLQERAVPGFVVADSPAVNVPGAYFEINTGGSVNMWGTKNNGSNYKGCFVYPIGRQ